MKQEHEHWSADEQNAFLADRWEEIRFVARCVVKNHPGPCGQSFVDESPAMIWSRLDSYDPNRPFRPWCRTVLRHALRDVYRKTTRERRSVWDEGVDLDAVIPIRDIRLQRQTQRRQEAWLDLQAPFSSEDLDRITTWRLPTRLTVLSFYGLAPKVPGRLWSDWVDELDLRSPFPETTDWGWSWSERVTALAEQMGRPVNTVSKTLKRHSEKLQDLAFVQDCLRSAA